VLVLNIQPMMLVVTSNTDVIKKKSTCTYRWCRREPLGNWSARG